MCVRGKGKRGGFDAPTCLAHARATIVSGPSHVRHLYAHATRASTEAALPAPAPRRRACGFHSRVLELVTASHWYARTACTRGRESLAAGVWTRRLSRSQFSGVLVSATSRESHCMHLPREFSGVSVSHLSRASARLTRLPRESMQCRRHGRRAPGRSEPAIAVWKYTGAPVWKYTGSTDSN